MQKEFLPFITNEQGVSLTENAGVVVTSAIPDPLNEAPEGWERNTIQFSRNNEFKGLIKSYTTPLKFFLEGAFILRSYFYLYGMESILYFIWLKLNINFGAGMKYEGWYKGEPDFSTFKDGDTGVEISITEGGLYKDIQSKKGTLDEYNLKKDPNAVSVLLDGMEIQQNGNYAVGDGALLYDNGQHCVDLNLISLELNGQITATSQTRRHFTNNADLLANSLPYLKTGDNVSDIKIESKFGVTVTLADGIPANPAAGSRLLVRMFDDAGTAIGFQILDSWGGASNLYGIHHTCNINTTIAAVPPNTRLYLLMFLTIGGVIASGSGADEVVFWTYDNADTDLFRTSYLFRYKSSVVIAQRAIDLGKRIISRISEDKSTMKSDLLENDFNLLISSGDAIRGIDNPFIKTNLTEYHKSIDAVKCISLGIEDNNARLEKRNYSFQNSEIANLGQSSNLVLTTANNYVYNEIQNGYPVTDIGDANGRFSFCNTSIYSTPVKRISNVYNIISSYLADPFVIEIIRINLDKKTTTDGASDNKNFFIDAEKVYANFIGNITATANNLIRLEGIVGLQLRTGIRFKVLTGLNAGTYTVRTASESGGGTVIITEEETVVTDAISSEIEWLHYRLRRKAYDVLTGVPSPSTVFNAELSPKTNLKNHYNWIYSCLDFMEGKKVLFKVTDRNGDLTRTEAGVETKEKEDIIISNAVMGPKIYRPYFLTFNAESPVNLLELMSVNNGLGYFTIDSFKGYPEDIMTNDATLETQQYKLLVTGDTDLKSLIKR